jgi:hypothetical protein
MAFYPSIRPETILSLNAVVLNLEKDPGYLDSPECHYSEDIKQFFRKKIEYGGSGKKEVPDLFKLEEGETDLGKLEVQIRTIINDLEDFGRKLDVSDSGDKMGYFRTKTALVDKLVSMQERVFNIKEVQDFRNIILGFMNEVLTKDQVTSFMQRLDGILGTNNDDIL